MDVPGMMVDVILPAGGRLEGDFAAEARTRLKALIGVDGRTVLERTMEALRATGCVRRIVVVGPEALAEHPAAAGADAVVPEGDSGPANILHGLAWLREADGGRESERVLVVTTDLPFITPQAITDFLCACPQDADICIPILRREAFDARFPGSPVTYARLRDGEWTMACAFLLNPAAVLANRVHLERVFAARKSEASMAWLLGPLFVARYLTRRLTVEHIATRCQQILGCRGVPVLNAAPELAYDIDRPEEYRYALRERIGNACPVPYGPGHE